MRLTGGLYRNVCPGISTSPWSEAASIMASACSDECASGFSTKTCFPAASTRMAMSWWVETGVAIAIASSVSSASLSSRSTVVCTAG